MAGDWIKLEHATPEKPEIYRLARLLGVSRGDAFLLAVTWWVWLDRNSCNGDVTLLLRQDIDELLRCQGFAAAMESIGWLKFDAEDHAVVTNFARHSGKTAKERALTKTRVSQHRVWMQAVGNGSVTVTPLPEKRREEKNLKAREATTAPPNGVAAPTPVIPKDQRPPDLAHGPSRRATRLAADWKLPEQWKQWAMEAQGIDAQRAVRISLDFRDYWAAKPGANGTKLDWEATWRRWVRKEVGDA